MPSTRGDFYKQLVEDAEDEPEEPEIVPQNVHDLVHDNVEDDREDDSGGELLGCTGLGTWNAAAVMHEGSLIDPGRWCVRGVGAVGHEV